MRREEIKQALDELGKNRGRNLVVVDFGNVDKWKEGLGWKIDLKQLGNLVKHFASGKKFLRRFYYGSDYGKREQDGVITMWSAMVLNKARMAGFEIITKPVKYIVNHDYKTGYVKKGNFDVEMAVDIIKEKDNYDTLILFSGDGDFAYVLKYIHKSVGKKVIVFGARDHIGKELVDAKNEGVVAKILFAEDFEDRLSMDHFRRR